MTLEEMNTLVKQIKTFKRWDRGAVSDWPALFPEKSEAYLEGSRLSVYMLALVGGWEVAYVLDFEAYPESEKDFWDYINSHLFIRTDYPEATVPPPDDPASAMLNLSTVLRATWVLKPCPYA